MTFKFPKGSMAPKLSGPSHTRRSESEVTSKPHAGPKVGDRIIAQSRKSECIPSPRNQAAENRSVLQGISCPETKQAVPFLSAISEILQKTLCLRVWTGSKCPFFNFKFKFLVVASDAGETPHVARHHSVLLSFQSLAGRVS